MTVRTNWTVLLLCLTIFIIYCNVLMRPNYGTQSFSSDSAVPNVNVQKIVAYSLEKQIEMDGVEHNCSEKFVSNATILKNSGKTMLWNRIEDSRVHIFSETIDRRLEPHIYLRFVGMIEGSWDENLYCQFLEENGHVQVIKATVTPIWYKKWDLNDNNTYYNPVLLYCRLPLHQFLPKAYYLSKSPCQISEKFREIIRPVERRSGNFTLCVKPLNFVKNMSLHLVQWMEINRILGADYFYIFLDNVTISTRKVLEWYKSRFPDMIHLEDFSSIDGLESKHFLQKTWQRRRYEIATYNKCFYQNLNSKYVIPLDIDELIIPKTVESWHDVVENSENRSALIVQNVYFFTNNFNRSNEAFFLKEITRSKAVSKKGENGKSFISTKNTLTVFNHYSLHLLRPGVIKEYFLPFKDVQLNHYKEFCNSVIFPECSKYFSSPRTIDNVIFKYRDRFSDRYKYVLNEIEKDTIKLF